MSVSGRVAVENVLAQGSSAGHKGRFGPNHVVLEAKGPSTGGVRTVAAVFFDGQVMVPFGSYAGQNSGIPIDPLTTVDFRVDASALFGFNGTEKLAKTTPGWLTEARVGPLMSFSKQVANAYADALINKPGASDV